MDAAHWRFGWFPKNLLKIGLEDECFDKPLQWLYMQMKLSRPQIV